MGAPVWGPIKVYHFLKEFDSTLGYPGEGPPKSPAPEEAVGDPLEVIDLTVEPLTKVYFIEKVMHDFIRLSTIGGAPFDLPLQRHDTKTIYGPWNNSIAVAADLSTITVCDVGRWANKVTGAPFTTRSRIFRNHADPHPGGRNQLIAHFAGLNPATYQPLAPRCGPYAYLIDMPPVDDWITPPHVWEVGTPSWMPAELAGTWHLGRLAKQI